MPRIWLWVVPILAVLLCGQSAQAQRQRGQRREEGPVYTDRKDAGPDYQTQGEYVTEPSAGAKYGAQVVALGDGKFQVILLPGGLPGDGYAGSGRVQLTAAREGQNVAIADSNGYSGSIAEGQLALKTSDGKQLAMKRVERVSPRAGAKPPPQATVLFDGTNTAAWQKGKMDTRHLLEAGTRTKEKYQDFTLHVEFLLPFKPLARDQERGNSGIYIQDRYEVQILDTFGHGPEFNGCGSLYRQKSPRVDMCYPPLQWQTYDIEFHAAQFDENGKKIKNAAVTVNQNGVIVQDHYAITSKTGAGAPEGPSPGPIQLQGHNNPVFFRNVWVIAK